MKLTGKFHTALAFTTLLIAATISMPLSAYAAVCSEGTGLPPFLSAGTDPNLLLILDNSGSMLDLAMSKMLMNVLMTTLFRQQYIPGCLTVPICIGGSLVLPHGK